MKNSFPKHIAIVTLLFLSTVALLSCHTTGRKTHGFIHRNGVQILNSDDENFIFRGIGPGGWMLQEGYMFKTKVGTQYEIREMLSSLTDSATSNDFYNEWLKHFFTRQDVERIQTWGFNSIRVPIHYNLFTPAIENEVDPSTVTWHDLGFTMLDSLLVWCTDNEIYLVIDLHAAPGGQGANASISDYDPSKPSLWESEYNQNKMVQLWRKLANRYKNEPYIGGYDLLNETNWPFEGDGQHANGCDCQTNVPLLSLYQRTIDAIREVDQNHLIFVEGNCWANNFSGLHSLAEYDNNLAFSFHKYWNFNTDNELSWVLKLRDSLNIPFYLGETGENSNTWFSDMVALVEKHNIGWSQWAYKQMDNDDPYTIISPSWKAISEYNPNTGSNRPSEQDARLAMSDMLTNIRTKHCHYNAGVVQAYMSHIKGNKTKAYKCHKLPGTIYATDYDIGPINAAWFDTDYQTIHSIKSTSNKGSMYRNDGIDITYCHDKPSNGFKVGWTEQGEWMQYTLDNIQTGNYDICIRTRGNKGALQLKIDEKLLTKAPLAIIESKNETWHNAYLRNIAISSKNKTLRIEILNGGMDINYLKFELK